MTTLVKVEGHSELVRDLESGAILNTSKSAYLKARIASQNAQKRNDELRDATRQINNLKCEMHEIKHLLQQMVKNSGN